MDERIPEPKNDSPSEPPTRGRETPCGCTMIDSVYLKANGELPCWCFEGEYHVLDRVDLEGLRSPNATILGLPLVERIRQYFLEGEMPYPALCSVCYALGTRKTSQLRPNYLDQLMIEPSYLCNLDCPECLSPTERLYYKSPPHILSPEFLRAFLDCLHSDGIEEVRFAHFEGRGDPLLNPQLGSLLSIVKEAFPGIQTMVTTHGNYPYKPFLMSGDLDVLRISINGAFPESYARYQRGGSLEKVLDLLREIRAHRRVTGSRLVVEWKYILFEWNDSDEELARAAQLADELEARLLFVMTNTRGLSKRFSNPLDWYHLLSRLAPRARLTDLDDAFAMGRIEAERRQLEERVERPLAVAFDASRRGWSRRADRHLKRALAGAGCRKIPKTPRVFLPVDALPQILEKFTAAHLVEALAEIALANEEYRAAEELFLRFLQLQPETGRRCELEALLITLVLLGRLGTAEPSEFFAVSRSRLEDAERALLRIHPGHHPAGGPPTPGDEPSGWLETVQNPTAVRVLGYFRWARGDYDAAHEIFASYLDRPRDEKADPTDGGLQARTLERLTIDPSFLGALDGPTSPSPDDRDRLERAPTLFKPDFFRTTLECLRREGINELALADFDGRGDPMLNPHLGPLLGVVKEAFPGVRTMVTTDGNCPYQPFLNSGDLDVLRVTINGARPESYAWRNRGGGSLEAALDFLREIRDRRRRARSRLVVEWDYTLFEWNDSDEELALAGRLAEELETQLLFVITNAAGFSKRFRNPVRSFRRLHRLAPRARVTVLDDARAMKRIEKERRRLEGRVARPIAVALDASRRGRSRQTARFLKRALGAAGYRSGSTPDRTLFPVDELPLVLEKIAAGHLVEALAEIALANEEFRAAEAMFLQYLRIQPETERRSELEALLTTLVLRGRLGTADPSEFFALAPSQLYEAERALLCIHPGHHPAGGPPTPDDDPAGWLDAVEDPVAVRALGYLRWARSDLDAAYYIFTSYLETPRSDEESQSIRWALTEIDSARSDPR